jgi:uncharacterized RDD family membrane protein YckC
MRFAELRKKLGRWVTIVPDEDEGQETDRNDAHASGPDKSVHADATIVVGFWKRLLADILDAVALGAVGWAIAYPFRYSCSELGPRAAWIGLAASLLYFGLLQTRFGRGQTLGKRALNIQVLRRDGAYLGLSVSLMRYLVVSFVFYNGMYVSFLTSSSPRVAEVVGSVFLAILFWVFLACFLMIPFHPLKRGLHDLVSGSVVVKRGSYDAGKLAKLENPQREERLLVVMGALAVLMCAATVLGVRRAVDRIDMTRLTSLQSDLAKKYEVMGVSETTFDGAHRTLNIDVWVPLRTQEDAVERERLRSDILARTRAQVPRLEDFENVRIWVNSGFRLGIANMRTRR